MGYLKTFWQDFKRVFRQEFKAVFTAGGVIVVFFLAGLGYPHLYLSLLNISELTRRNTN